MRGIDSKTYYELLGVSPEATKEEIKVSYREIARIYHPDSNFFDEIIDGLQQVSSAPAEDATFKIITNAYNILMDDQKRAAYDALLPKNLAAWDEDEDEIPSGYDDGRFQGEFVAAPKGSEVIKKAPAFGTFGSSTQPESAFDANLDPVYRHNSGLWDTMLRLFGLRR